ncbi:MAG: hypothetical protein NUW37_17245 [Planctomycetes bacterium]|nr:hypothetical protein [Planctomycetota bacterium]
MKKQAVDTHAQELEDRLIKIQRIKDLIQKDQYDLESKFDAAMEILFSALD